ncbi:MAG: hypothetical protein ACRCV9_16610 [Burkholderiaceae bacterium]
MKVIDHEPHGWFLLQDEIGYILDVNCTESHATYTVAFRLNAEEVAQIELGRHKAVDELARAVMRDADRSYFNQRRDTSLDASISAAVVQWRANRPAA